MIFRLHKHLHRHVKKYHKHYLGLSGIVGLVMLFMSLIASITQTFAASSSTSGPNYPSVGSNVSGTGTISWINPNYVTANDANYATVVFPADAT